MHYAKLLLKNIPKFLVGIIYGFFFGIASCFFYIPLWYTEEYTDNHWFNIGAYLSINLVMLVSFLYWTIALFSVLAYFLFNEDGNINLEAARLWSYSFFFFMTTNFVCYFGDRYYNLAKESADETKT